MTRRETMDSENLESKSPDKQLDEEVTIALGLESSSYGHGCDLGDTYNSLIDYEDDLQDFLDKRAKDDDTEGWANLAAPKPCLKSPDFIDMGYVFEDIIPLKKCRREDETTGNELKTAATSSSSGSITYNLVQDQSSIKDCSLGQGGSEIGDQSQFEKTQAKPQTALSRRCHEKDEDGFLKPTLPSPKAAVVSSPLSGPKAGWNEYLKETLTKSRQLKSNEANLNMNKFQAWITQKAKSNEITLSLTSRVLAYEKTQDLLKQKIAELRSDRFLMENRTTKELYLILVSLLKELLQEQWQRIERKYYLTSRFLEELT